MDPLVLAILVGIPAAWQVALTAYVYRDAPRRGMDRGRWTAVTLLVPFFGFFAYLFEREERQYDPSEDPYARGTYNIHERRADDVEPNAGRHANEPEPDDGRHANEPEPDDGRHADDDVLESRDT